LHLKQETKAISTLLAILLILASTIIGAFISYMWVMGSYYNMPENSTLLVVENVVFPTDNFTYFNTTILNPSDSVSDVNITDFRLSIESRNETYMIETADPSLPFYLKIGARQSFRCITNWSNFAGETATIEPVAADASTKSNSYPTPMAKLAIFDFNASESVEYFNVTVENYPESVMNLTVSDIMIDTLSVNATPPLTQVLQPGQTQTFRCKFGWMILGGENATITVRTAEGFEQNYLTDQIRTALIYVGEPKFDYTNTTYFNVPVTSFPQSTTEVTLDRVNLTLQDNTTISVDTVPSLNILPISVSPNQSLTLMCLWDWNAHRNENITVNVYTRPPGFPVQGNTTTTPATVVWNVEDVGFDLDDLEHFSVNVTNALCSLQQINVTRVELNLNAATLNPVLIAPGGQSVLNCGFNWTSLVGKNVTVTVYAAYGSNELSHSKNATLPYLKIVNVSFSNFELGNPYVNVTIYNSQFSKLNTNMTQLFVKTDNGTFLIDGNITNPRINPEGYSLVAGAEVTVVCPWNWSPFLNKQITVTMQTSDGFQVTKTLKVE
jgi:hypothetical protein